MKINPINILFFQKTKNKNNNNFVSNPTFCGELSLMEHLSSQKKTAKEVYESGINKVLKDGLSVDVVSKIAEEIESLKKQIDTAQQKMLAYGRLMDYDKLKKSGIPAEMLDKFIKQDDKIIEDAEKSVIDKNEAKNYYFGYPLNFTPESAVSGYLRYKELELPLLNNCADTYEQGNSKLNSKETEKELLNELYRHFGLEEPYITDVFNPETKKYERHHTGAWGYITSGGSESNRWGIENGLKQMGGGRVYFSQAAHYSVDKAVNIGTDIKGENIKSIEHTVIPTQSESEKIDTKVLMDTIRKNWEEKKEPAIVLLTWGTTKTGGLDDVKYVSQALKRENIPHYIHLDAALSGGIPNNQTDAPTIPNIKELGVDSVSVSLHKYFGLGEVKSVVIAQNHPNTKQIDYIGQGDGTTAGSRSHKPFSTLQKVREVLDRSAGDEYIKNIQKFENILKKYEVPFSREEHANTFVIDKPADKICKKYQLSTFTLQEFDAQSSKTVLKEKAHIIIFPHHQEAIMNELAEDLIKN